MTGVQTCALPILNGFDGRSLFRRKDLKRKNSLFGEQGCDFHIYFLSAACAGIYDILVVQSYYSIFVGVWVDGKIVSLDIIFFYT